MQICSLAETSWTLTFRRPGVKGRFCSNLRPGPRTLPLAWRADPSGGQICFPDKNRTKTEATGDGVEKRRVMMRKNWWHAVSSMSVLPGRFLEEEQKVGVVVTVSCFVFFSLPMALDIGGLFPGKLLSLHPPRPPPRRPQ